MDGTWQIVKWIWVAVCFIWIAVQALAMRRLKGDLKRRSNSIGFLMLAFLMISDWIAEVFENVVAARVGRLAVGVAAIVATVFLVAMLRQKSAAAPNGEDNAGDYVQPLKLN